MIRPSARAPPGIRLQRPTKATSTRHTPTREAIMITFTSMAAEDLILAAVVISKPFEI